MRATDLALVSIVLGYAALFCWFSPFVADDAYIVYRYSENLIDGHGLVFNHGEPILALTSPLHALLCSAVYWMTGTTVWPSRIVAGLFQLGAIVWAARALRIDRAYWPVIGLMTVGSPYVVLWTAGGLETPLLSGLLLLTYAAGVRCREAPGFGPCAAFSAWVALTFLARYDSVLITLPMGCHVAWGLWRSSARRDSDTARRALGLVVPGCVLAFGWLAISLSYYHDILPTSFYSKRPGWSGVPEGARYIAQFLVVGGIIPLAVWLGVDRAGRATMRRTRILRLLSRDAGLVVGLTLFLLYAVPSATTHMMFAYRLLLPVLPLAVLLMVRAWAATRETAEADAASGRLGRVASIAGLVILAVAQAAQAFVIDTRSINPGWVGEYTDVSRREYVRFMELQGEQAAAIRTHWKAHGTAGRPPRIHVYAAGLIPYRLREANVVDGGLISNRHHVNVHSGHRGLLFSSDYVMTLAPKHQSLRHQLGRPPQAMELVDERQMFFDGRMETFRIFFDSSPIGYELPFWIDGKPIAPVPPPFGSDRR